MTESVPFLDIVAQQAEVNEQISTEIAELLSNAAFIGGAAVERFEHEYARFAGVRECVGVANGTDALELALRGLGIGAGDEVLVPTNSFIASAEAVVRAGASVRFADVDDEALLLDHTALAETLTANTTAVMAVDLYGQPAPFELLAPLTTSAGAVLIEDGAQSQGAHRWGEPAGSLAPIAATSFYPGKNLGAAGDAGAVLSNDHELLARVRVIAAHGSAVKYEHEVLGFNSRLDAIQAVVLSAKLARLDAWNAARRDAADRYALMLSDIPGLRLPGVLPGNESSWHLYVVRLAERDRVLEGLKAAGIGAALHYPTPIHLTQAFRSSGYAVGDFPIAERAATEILSLPMFPHITEAQQQRVADELRRLV